MAGSLGFEPRSTESESAALPDYAMSQLFGNPGENRTLYTQDQNLSLSHLASGQ